MIVPNDEYRAVARRFKKLFGYGVPLDMLPMTADMDELIRNIEDCIARQTDDLLPRYGVDTSRTDILY